MKILLLEDEQIIRDVVSEYVQDANMEMVSVATGEDAIKCLKRELYDIAILDIMVPGALDGMDVLRWIRQEALALPVIMLSALGDEQTQLEAFDIDVDDYVTKPFSPRLLLRRIEAVLKRHQALPQVILDENFQLVAEIDSYQFFYRGKSIGFTLTEFMLFYTMYQHPNVVFTRDHLLDVIYRDDVFPNDRVIDAHIKNIRKKLPLNVITTCKGIGYKYEEV